MGLRQAGAQHGSRPLRQTHSARVLRILAHDPSNQLPLGWSEQKRYFFTCKEAKYVKGHHTNRVTGAGYWKATGMEKPVTMVLPTVVAARGGNQLLLIGMKRSLVFYRGKPPSSSKMDWVMQEYRLTGASLAPCRCAVHADSSDAAPDGRMGALLCVQEEGLRHHQRRRRGKPGRRRGGSGRGRPGCHQVYRLLRETKMLLVLRLAACGPAIAARELLFLLLYIRCSVRVFVCVRSIAYV